MFRDFAAICCGTVSQARFHRNLATSHTWEYCKQLSHIKMRVLMILEVEAHRHRFIQLLIQIFRHWCRNLMGNRIKGKIPPELGTIKSIQLLWVTQSHCDTTNLQLKHPQNHCCSRDVDLCLGTGADFWMETSWRDRSHQNWVTLRAWSDFSSTRIFSAATFPRALET